MSHRRSVVVLALAASTQAAAQMFVEKTAMLFPIQSEYTNQVTSADIDNDGDLDLLWANGGDYSAPGTPRRARIYVNRLDEPAGRFVDESDLRASGVLGLYRDVQAGDVDGDGDIDLLLAQDFLRQPHLLINDGDGFFVNEAATRIPPALLSSSHAQFADVDNDGDLDLFLCHSGASRFGSGKPQLYLNDGLGHFTDAPDAQTPSTSLGGQMDCTVADVDGDLDLDVLITRLTGPAVLWLNDGAGAFTNVAGFIGGASAYAHDFGDLDGDGDLDLISVSVLPEGLFRNELPAGWTDISSDISPNEVIDDNDSRFVDYDDDGDMDLIVASLLYPERISPSERVYRNDGPGVHPQFVQVFNVLPLKVDATLDLEVADFDGDGRLDIATAQGEEGDFQNRIYINALGPIDSRPPTITHVEAIGDAILLEGSAGPFAVRATILDATSGDRGFVPSAITLNATLADGSQRSVAMVWVGNNQWRGVIPAQTSCGVVTYSVTAVDRPGNSSTSDGRTFSITGAVIGDLDGDCVVGGGDLGQLLAEWGVRRSSADLNGDGQVDGADLGLLLSAWDA